MNTSRDEHRRLRLSCLVAAAMILALVTAFAGCGPGVVGTGTGAPVPTAAASLCNASFASVLDCAGGGGALPGSAPVALSEAAVPGQVGVRVDIRGDAVVLEQASTGLRFEGRWSLLSDGTEAFAGSWSDTQHPQSAPGIVRVTPLDGGSRLEMQLFDADGQAIAGPWTLARGTVVGAGGKGSASPS